MSLVAYTIGSFWYCLDCVKELGEDPEAEPIREDELVDGTNYDGTDYHCDSCGGAIRRAS